MDITSIDPMNELDLAKVKPEILVSPKNPTPMETVFLSNIDQAVTFPVDTVFFFHSPSKKNSSSSTQYTAQRVKKSVAEVLPFPYYFMAGRLRAFMQQRWSLVCDCKIKICVKGYWKSFSSEL